MFILAGQEGSCLCNHSDHSDACLMNFEVGRNVQIFHCFVWNAILVVMIGSFQFFVKLICPLVSSEIRSVNQPRPGERFG